MWRNKLITPVVSTATLVSLVIYRGARLVRDMIGSNFESDTPTVPAPTAPTPTESIPTVPTPTPTLKDRKGTSKYSEYCFFVYNHYGRLLSSNVMNPEIYKRITGVVALDCKMVGIGDGGTVQALARVSVVNSYGYCLFDTFVQPEDIVTAYRTQWSGIRTGDLDGAPPASYATNKVAELIKGNILIGHNTNRDLEILGITHPERDIRDTAEIFGKLLGRQEQLPSLKFLAEKYFGIYIQEGQHNSIEDAQMAMALNELETFGRVWIQKRLSPVNNLDSDVASIDRLAEILQSGLGNLRTEIKTLKQEILANRNEVFARLDSIEGSLKRGFGVESTRVRNKSSPWRNNSMKKDF